MFSNNEQKQVAYRMQIFAEVVKQGSFTRAADSLGHTRSAVSTYISQLETMLGCRLLNRTTRKLKLTAVGEQFARRSQELQSLIDLSLAEVRAQQSQPHGTLRIIAPNALGEFLLIPLLSSWSRQFPGYQLDLQLSDEYQDLMKQKFDIALRVGELADSSYRQIGLGNLDNVAVIAPSLYLKQSLSEVRTIALPWQQTLEVEAQDKTRIVFDGENTLRVNSVSSAVSAADNGLGLAVVPSLFVASKLRSGELYQVETTQPLSSRPVSLLHAYETLLPPALRELAERLKLAFQAGG